MDPYSQEYMDMEAYVASLTPEVKKAMVEWEKKRIEMERKLGLRK